VEWFTSDAPTQCLHLVNKLFSLSKLATQEFTFFLSGVICFCCSVFAFRFLPFIVQYVCPKQRLQFSLLGCSLNFIICRYGTTQLSFYLKLINCFQVLGDRGFTQVSLRSSIFSWFGSAYCTRLHSFTSHHAWLLASSDFLLPVYRCCLYW
jgi:hypothetical protein